MPTSKEHPASSQFKMLTSPKHLVSPPLLMLTTPRHLVFFVSVSISEHLHSSPDVMLTLRGQRYLKCSVPSAHGKGTELSGTPETILVVTAPRGKGAKASGEMTITLMKQMCTRVRAATPTKDRH